MIRKRYRVQVDFDVMIHEPTPERCAAVFERFWAGQARLGLVPFPESRPDGPSQDAIDSTQALMAEIMKDPALLDSWICKGILLYAEDAVAGANQASERDREILHPAVERLPPRARHWWREAFNAGDADDDAMVERVEYLFDTVSFHTRRPTVFEVDLGE